MLSGRCDGSSHWAVTQDAAAVGAAVVFFVFFLNAAVPDRQSFPPP